MKIKETRTAKGLFIPPSTEFQFSGANTQWSRGVVCGGVSEGSYGKHALFAGINLGYLPDFCGGRMVGCLNLFSREYREGPHKHLPELPDLADDLVSPWLRHTRSRYERKYAWCAIGLWHHILSFSSSSFGAGCYYLWDRVGGPTKRISEFALDALNGVVCVSRRDAAGWDTTGCSGRVSSVVTGLQFVNPNSGSRVQAMQVLVKRGGCAPGDRSSWDGPIQQPMVSTANTYGLTFPVTLDSPFYPM